MAMLSRFKMKDIGACKTYLGMEIAREKQAIRLTQAKFTTHLLQDAGLWDAKSKPTLMEAGLEIEPADVPIRMEDFRRLVGKIQWLAVISRPDIAHATSRLASVVTKPSETAWVALKRVLRYLRGTVNEGLVYQGSSPLQGYSDANWAEGSSAKSTTGVIFMLNNGPIHWFTKRQSVVALSTCEAEYIAASTATQDATWIGPHVREIQGTEPSPVPIWVDNQGAIALAKKTGWNRRTRHINVRYQFVQKAIEDGTILMEYVPTDSQLADGLTKALKSDKYGLWRALIGPFRGGKGADMNSEKGD